MPITTPAGAIKQSYINIALVDSVAPPLATVRAYMERYPYDSLEHKVSRAIVLDDPTQWQSIVDTLPTYIDNDGLLRYWPRDTSRGSAELIAYILSISSAHGFTLPESQKTRLISALQAVAEGRLTQRGYGRYDVRAIRIAALAALARNGSASANMISAIRMSPSEMTTITLSDWLVILDKTAAIQRVADLRRTAENEMRRRIVYEGMRLDLIDDANSPWWMMISRDEMAIKALDAVMGRATWKVDDGRMMIGIAQRQRYGRWDSTPANAWGAVVLRHFAKLYPAQAITGATMVNLGSTSMKQSWPLAANATPISLQLTQGPLQIEHQGTGAPWATVTVRAAVPLKSPLQAGYSISRKVIPVAQKVANQWTRGDVIKILLTFKANAGRTWVAIRDPLPPGASMLGNLGSRSLQLVQNGQSSGAQPDYVEAGLDNWQAHFGWLQAGEHRVEYVMRLNGSGTFSLPETRIEALYAPSIRGAWPNGSFRVVGPNE